MANTYTLIGSPIVVGSGVSSISFTSIPNTFTDLLVKTSLRADPAAVAWNYKLTFNGTSSGYSGKVMYGSGTSKGSFNSNTTYFDGIYIAGSTATVNTFDNNEIYIPNYAGSNYKSTSVNSTVESNTTNTILSFEAGLWSNTAAITSITIQPESSGNIVQYSTAYLYGISNS